MQVKASAGVIDENSYNNGRYLMVLDGMENIS